MTELDRLRELVLRWALVEERRQSMVLSDWEYRRWVARYGASLEPESFPGGNQGSRQMMRPAAESPLS